MGLLCMACSDKEIITGQRCPYMETCRIIQDQQDSLPSLVKRFKNRYCFKNHHVCARRWIQDFLGVEKVPDLMMPQQYDWAEQLLFEAGVPYTTFEEKYRVLLSAVDHH